MRYKSIPTEFKADLDKRRIEGYASIFGNVDLGKDISHKGSFSKTIKERMPKGSIKFMRDHRTLIGAPEHLEEDEKGLLTVNRVSKTQLGDETLEMVRDGTLTEMSYGYDIIKSDFSEVGGEEIRNLREQKLWETSVVTWGMNPDTSIIGVKEILKDAKIDSSNIDALKSAIDLMKLSQDQKHDIRQLIAFIKTLNPSNENTLLEPLTQDSEAVKNLLSIKRELLNLKEQINGKRNKGA